MENQSWGWGPSCLSINLGEKEFKPFLERLLEPSVLGTFAGTEARPRVESNKGGGGGGGV